MNLDPGVGLDAATMTLADGRTLRYVRAGEGNPVVVFEAGLGACASEWATTQRMVSTSVSTVSYDRAGYAGSTPDPQPRSLARICQDLHAVIEAASPNAPVVLIGHSYGGPMVRCYCEQHPERVAGVVLVDATVSAVMSPTMAKISARMFSFMLLMHRLGLGTAMMKRGLRLRPSPDFPAEDRELLERDIFARHSVRASVGEAREISASLPLMARWEDAGLPAVPAVCLVGNEAGRRDRKIRATLIATYEREMARHPNGECRIVAGAGHFVPQEQPRATADAILDIVAAVRRG